jgi:hypothetical protein
MMSKPENTTAKMRDPAEALLFLTESMDGDPGAPILRQERDGQRQLVNSDRLPSDIHGGRAGWEALGFTFGDPDPDDPMFMPATLPDGWKRRGTEHAMWSEIADTHGRPRVAIFYKAAFYDRRAFMRLNSLDSYVSNHVEYDGPLAVTDDWATSETVPAALARLRDEYLEEACRYRGYAGEGHRSDDNRAALRKIAAEKDDVAARYAAKLAEMTS